MSQRLLLLGRERRFVDSHLRGPVRLVVLWCSRNRMLNHGASEYRRVRTQTHAMRRSSASAIHGSVRDTFRFPALLAH